MPKDESPYERDRSDPPLIGQGVMPPVSGSTTWQKAILVAFFSIAAVLVIANRHAIVKSFEDPRTPEEKAAAEAVADPNALPTATCGDLDDWKICTAGVKRRKSISDSLRRWSTNKDSVFLTVKVKISHREKSPRNTMGFRFYLADAEGNRYSTDDDIPIYLRLDGEPMCEFLTEDVNPGFYTECWTVFYMTKGTPGIHLIAEYTGDRLRLSLGE